MLFVFDQSIFIDCSGYLKVENEEPEVDGYEGLHENLSRPLTFTLNRLRAMYCRRRNKLFLMSPALPARTIMQCVERRA
jgi:hypothetical protein